MENYTSYLYSDETLNLTTEPLTVIYQGETELLLMEEMFLLPAKAFVSVNGKDYD